jgi:hypothetical protein
MNMHIHKSGEALPATIIFNVDQIINAVVVRLEETFFTQQQEYLLEFDLKRKKWIELNNSHITEPVFFEELLKQLTSILAQAEMKINCSYTKRGHTQRRKKILHQG